MKNLVLLMMLACFGFFPCDPDDCDDLFTGGNYGPIYPTITVLGTVTDSLTGQPLENTVIWRRDPFGIHWEAYCITNDLGNYSFSMSITPEDSTKGNLFYFSKSHYNLKRMWLYARDMDSLKQVRLIQAEIDSVSPYVLFRETLPDYGLDKVHIKFTFSEEVIFNEEYLQDLAQLIFSRKANICSSLESFYLYEYQDAGYQVTPTSITFSHFKEDCDSCYSGYGSYSYKQCEQWELESVKLLPWLCTDPSGNFLRKYEFSSK